MTEPPIRVCYLLSHFHPRESGAERQALAQGRQLVRMGHSVRVVTRQFDDLPAEGEVDGIRIHRRIRTSERGALFALSFVKGAIAALRDLRPHYDLIHTHQALWEAIATGLGRDLFRGAPVLVQPASSGYFGEAEEMARTKGYPLLRRIALRNRAFAAISADIDRQWRAMGVPAAHIVRTASGVDADHYRPGPSPLDAALPPGPRVVFTGRLHPQKNVDLLLNAWSDVAGRVPGTLVLVGDGPEQSALERQARDLGSQDRVQFAGRVPDPADHLRAGALFALPSVAEGMSNSLLEAMATGLPCLASRIGGNTDLIDDGETGRLIAPGDRRAWASALFEGLTDIDRSRRMGEQARRKIEGEFAMPVVAAKYVAIYRGLMANGAGLRGR